jgi:hypothetical protein
VSRLIEIMDSIMFVFVRLRASRSLIPSRRTGRRDSGRLEAMEHPDVRFPVATNTVTYVKECETTREHVLTIGRELHAGPALPFRGLRGRADRQRMMN